MVSQQGRKLTTLRKKIIRGGGKRSKNPHDDMKKRKGNNNTVVNRMEGGHNVEMLREVGNSHGTRRTSGDIGSGFYKIF